MGERRRSVRNESAFMLALVITCGFLGMIFVVLLRGIPPENNSIAQQIISIMSMIMGGIGGYFYGASKSNTETATALAARTRINNPETDPIKADTVNVDAKTATITTETKP